MDDLIYPHHRRHYHYHYDLRHIAQWTTKKITFGGGEPVCAKDLQKKKKKHESPKKRE